MPTTLTVLGGVDEHEKAYEAWKNLIRKDSNPEEADLNILISVFNNSLVGVSKMLHFAAPEKFAIWDSKVAAACNYPLHGNRRRNAGAYVAYVRQLREIVEDVKFISTYEQVKKLISDKVINAGELSKLRVGELLLFTLGSTS